MTDEYQEVAAIVCMDVDLLATVAENESLDADFLRGSIKLLKEKKDAVINDPKSRSMRYSSMQNVLSVAVMNK